MSTHRAPGESEAERKFAAERDRVEFSPAQPSGPDRIDDDGAVMPPAETFPPDVKFEGTGRMEH
jgi:hypothetical protein